MRDALCRLQPSDVSTRLLGEEAANGLTLTLSSIHVFDMGKKDARVDAYIANSGDFARPILNYLRRLVHAACPEVEETLKWRFPNFMYKGMLCSMAAFKEHCSFGFWK